MKMEVSDFLVILAILVAPLLAVEVQKRLDIMREDRRRKEFIFKTLMSTRAAVVSPRHVEALNMIDLEFVGKKYLSIVSAWKIYIDHLYSFPKENENQQLAWGNKRIELLSDLLIEMGKSLGYSFDQVHVKKAIYSPEAHAQIEDELTILRRGLAGVLEGKLSVPVRIDTSSTNKEEIAEQVKLRQMMFEHFEGKRSISVRIERDNPAEQSKLGDLENIGD